MTKQAVLFPGQGAQYPGMGADFFNTFLSAKEIFQEADDLLGEALSRLIFEGSQAELMATNRAQIAIYVTSLAIYRTLQSQFPRLTFDIAAGLSLGEYSALTAASFLSFQEGVQIVRARGQAMHEASMVVRGGMSVVLGMTAEQIKPHLHGKRVYVANVNCPGQVVISGTLEGLEEVTHSLKEAGAKRVLPLDVSGAFHSPLMESAKEEMRPLLERMKTGTLSMDVVMNVPGDFVSDEGLIRGYLVDQVTSPTLWERGIERMVGRGVEKALEIGPGKTVAGMNRKMDLPTYTLTKVEDLDGISEWEESLNHRGNVGAR